MAGILFQKIEGDVLSQPWLSVFSQSLPFVV